MMRPLVIAGRLVAVVGAAYVLIATSAPRTPCIATPPVTFKVAGTCGQTGLIVVRAEGAGRISVENAERAGLPSEGSSPEYCPYSLASGVWALETRGCSTTIATDAGATDAGSRDGDGVGDRADGGDAGGVSEASSTADAALEAGTPELPASDAGGDTCGNPYTVIRSCSTAVDSNGLLVLTCTGLNPCKATLTVVP